MLQLKGFLFTKWSNSSIWPVHDTLIGTITQDQGGPGNQGINHILRGFMTGQSPSNGLVTYPEHLGGGRVLPLSREAVDVFYSPSRLAWIAAVKTPTASLLRGKTNSNEATCWLWARFRNILEQFSGDWAVTQTPERSLVCNMLLWPILGMTSSGRYRSDQSTGHIKPSTSMIVPFVFCNCSCEKQIPTRFILKVLEGGNWESIALRKTRLSILGIKLNCIWGMCNILSLSSLQDILWLGAVAPVGVRSIGQIEPFIHSLRFFMIIYLKPCANWYGLVWFYGILTVVRYLMPKFGLYRYIRYISFWNISQRS